MKSIPTIGDMVIYYPTEEEKRGIADHGNTSDSLPAVVVAAWGETTLNLKVFTDGNGPDLWKTSVPKIAKGVKEPGYWNYTWDDRD